MQWLLLGLGGGYLVYLAAESLWAAGLRRRLAHVVHVNGIRGKSSVTRLIDAGLRSGGLRCFCKTTGTLPRIIGVDGREKNILRLGSANIKEQLRTLRQAVRQGAQVLVVECMAVNPELQWITQHRMLQADIGVITNVRLDHTDVMGATLPEIADSLAVSIPKGGRFFTADEDFFPRLSQRCEALGTTPHLAVPKGDEPDLDFAENIALALAVCESLGVKRDTALAGMAEHYVRDPYALSVHRLPTGALVVGGLAINDPDSIGRVYRQLREQPEFHHRQLTLLINSRPDRGFRTAQHLALAGQLAPERIWLLGPGRRIAAHSLGKGLTHTRITPLKNAAAVPLDTLEPDALLLCIGNIAGHGIPLMKRIEEGGERYVP